MRIQSSSIHYMRDKGKKGKREKYETRKETIHPSIHPSKAVPPFRVQPISRTFRPVSQYMCPNYQNICLLFWLHQHTPKSLPISAPPLGVWGRCGLGDYWVPPLAASRWSINPFMHVDSGFSLKSQSFGAIGPCDWKKNAKELDNHSRPAGTGMQKLAGCELYNRTNVSQKSKGLLMLVLPGLIVLTCNRYTAAGIDCRRDRYPRLCKLQFVPDLPWYYISWSPKLSFQYHRSAARSTYKTYSKSYRCFHICRRGLGIALGSWCSCR